jgi:hypothetical protein
VPPSTSSTYSVVEPLAPVGRSVEGAPRCLPGPLVRRRPPERRGGFRSRRWRWLRPRRRSVPHGRRVLLGHAAARQQAVVASCLVEGVGVAAVHASQVNAGDDHGERVDQGVKIPSGRCGQRATFTTPRPSSKLAGASPGSRARCILSRSVPITRTEPPDKSTTPTPGSAAPGSNSSKSRSSVITASEPAAVGAGLSRRALVYMRHLRVGRLDRADPSRIRRRANSAKA